MKVSNEVINVLVAAEKQGANLVLVGQLPRPLYEQTNKVLEAAGGKWNKKAKAHIFEEDAADAIEPILLTGEVQLTKQEFGQFDTPPELAEKLVAMARIEAGMKVFEPSCGIGNIIRSLRFGVGGGCHYFGNELDRKRFETCRSNFFPAGGITNNDFLAMDPAPVFHRVVMNPPFAKQADIDHVRHALKFLREGGRLVAIMGAGVRFREDRKAKSFRADMIKLGGVFEDLPEGSFKESGTGVNACTLAVSLPQKG